MIDYKAGDTIRYRLPGGGERICFVVERKEIAPGFPGFLGKKLDEDGNEIIETDRQIIGCFGYDRDVIEVLVGPI